MDTEAIAREIVTIRNRLDELDSRVEGASGTDVDDERTRLEQRLLFLQGQLSGDVGLDEPGDTETVHYVPPA